MGNTKSREEQVDVKFLKVQGLYSRCDWDEKQVRNLIAARKLNPCFPGEDVKRDHTDECPICMLYYPGGLNRSVCCKQPICTECFFQVKKTPKAAAQCPFCNSGNYNVFYKGKKTEEERQKEEEEEQRVIELRMKMMKEQEEEYQKKKGSSAASSEFSQSAPSSPQATTSSSYAAGVSPAVTPVRAAPSASSHQHYPSASSASRALNFVDDADVSFPEPSPFRTPERIPPPPRYQFTVPQPSPPVQPPPQPQPQRAVPENLSQYVPEHILRQTQNEEEIDDMLLREAIKASVESAKAQSSSFTEVDFGEPTVSTSSNINIFNNIIINNNNTASVASQPRTRPALPPVPQSTSARVDNTHRTPEPPRNLGQSLFDLLSWDAPLQAQPQPQPQSRPQPRPQAQPQPSSAFNFEDFFQAPPSNSSSSLIEDSNPVTPPPVQRLPPPPQLPQQQQSPYPPPPVAPQNQLSPEEDEEYQLALAISLSLASSRQAM